jgi:hypothetical protein
MPKYTQACLPVEIERHHYLKMTKKKLRFKVKIAGKEAGGSRDHPAS